ncbi:MAG: hypothetical protein J7K73_01570 [Nanoarchaeota archaeon]|nr:hypothetical protein [Nanoarchaeota archaeon]
MREVKVSKKEFLEIVKKSMSERVVGIPVKLVYYALIELPSGKHIPLPIALLDGAVGLKDLKKIPLSKKRRDNKFYTRPCGAPSFYRCPEWEVEEEESNLKKLALRRLIREGLHKKLRLVIPAIYKDEHGGKWGAWEFDRACEDACDNCPICDAWEHDIELCESCEVYKRMEGKR